MTEKEAKYVKIGAGVAVAFVLYKVLAPKTDNGGGDYDPTGNGSGSASNPLYPFNATKTANALKDAMKELGTDEDAIISELTSVTQAQFAQVVKAFGKKSYNPTTGNQYFAFWQTPIEYPLNFWLKNELSAARYNILKLKYPSYL